jgi:hypothetical protein
MTPEESQILTKKAKTKNDGVYKYKGYTWAVKNNRFIAFVDWDGTVYENFGAFNVRVGKVEIYDARKELLKYLKKIT